jgi:integrase
VEAAVVPPIDPLECDPAEPRTVAAWVVDVSDRLAAATVARHLAAIRTAHALAEGPNPMDDPWLKDVLAGLRRARPQRSVGKEAVTVAEVRRMILALPDTAAGARDAPILLTAFGAALRARSELVALDVDDLEFSERGVVLHLRRSKVDQEGSGDTIAIPRGKHPETCAATALHRWLTVAGIDQGPLFRPISKSGRVLSSRLTGRSVARVVHRAATAAGIPDPERFGTHGLRAGLITAAALLSSGAIRARRRCQSTGNAGATNRNGGRCPT